MYRSVKRKDLNQFYAELISHYTLVTTWLCLICIWNYNKRIQQVRPILQLGLCCVHNLVHNFLTHARHFCPDNTCILKLSPYAFRPIKFAHALDFSPIYASHASWTKKWEIKSFFIRRRRRKGWHRLRDRRHASV